MAQVIYSNVNIPAYRLGRFQFRSGLLKLTDESDKNLFLRLLAQLPSIERNNIVEISNEVVSFPADWILRLDLLLAEIASKGPVAQQTARDNLGIVDVDTIGKQEVFVQMTRPATAGPWVWWQKDALGNIINLTINDGL
jgi:hypothetical protein